MRAAKVARTHNSKVAVLVFKHDAQQVDLRGDVIISAYKRDIARCDERSCECICNCHAGDDCLIEKDERETYKLKKTRVYCAGAATCEGHVKMVRENIKDVVPRGHSRNANEAHKRAHRECEHDARVYGVHNRK